VPSRAELVFFFLFSFFFFIVDLRAPVGAEESEVIMLLCALIGPHEFAVLVHAAREKLPNGDDVGLVPGH
jgi:hypothetical protein